jgi:hypothetical protein
VRAKHVLLALSLLALSSPVLGVPITWSVGSGGNGHSYDFISGTGITFSAANAAASSAGGYLVTITSAAENDFLVANFGSASLGYAWIGASDAAVEGEWRWVTGPEAGSQFWDGSTGTATAPFNFARWAQGQPDDFLNQDFAYFALSVPGTPTGGWLDTNNSGQGGNGYLIEFDAVPEPSLGALLGLSSFLLVARVRRGARQN